MRETVPALSPKGPMRETVPALSPSGEKYLSPTGGNFRSIMVVQSVGSFIERRLKYRSLRIQIVAAVLAGFAYAFDIGAIYLILEGEARIRYEGTVIVLTLMYAFVPLVLWLLLTTAFYLITVALGGRSEYSVLLRGTGWGMIPFVGASAALGLARYVGVRGKEPCNYSQFVCGEDETVPTLLEQVDAVFSFANTATSATGYKLLFGVFTVLLLVSAAIWWITLEKSTNLTNLGVTVAVGLPVAAYYVLMVLVTF